MKPLIEGAKRRVFERPGAHRNERARGRYASGCESPVLMSEPVHEDRPEGGRP